jgi:hypothetical protein
MYSSLEPASGIVVAETRNGPSAAATTPDNPDSENLEFATRETLSQAMLV